MSDLRIKADNLGRLYRDFVRRARLLLLLLTEKNSAQEIAKHVSENTRELRTKL